MLKKIDCEINPFASYMKKTSMFQAQQHDLSSGVRRKVRIFRKGFVFLGSTTPRRSFAVRQFDSQKKERIGDPHHDFQGQDSAVKLPGVYLLGLLEVKSAHCLDLKLIDVNFFAAPPKILKIIKTK